jgi:hypothetical protein
MHNWSPMISPCPAPVTSNGIENLPVLRTTSSTSAFDLTVLDMREVSPGLPAFLARPEWRSSALAVRRGHAGAISTILAGSAKVSLRGGVLRSA